MSQPPGCEDSKFPQHVCKPKKAIYGLKQAPEAWYSKLSTKLQELGFVLSKSDISMLILCDQGTTMFVFIYVDDLVIASSSTQASDKLLQQLKAEFAIKDLGPLRYFLGIEVVDAKKGIWLTQKKIYY